MTWNIRHIQWMPLVLGMSIGGVGWSGGSDRLLPSNLLPSNPSSPDLSSPNPSSPDTSQRDPSHPVPSQPDISQSTPSEMEELVDTLICSGSIEDGPDFTAYYTQSDGFSRIDLGSPQNHITTNLTFSNYDAEGQAVWQGYAFDRAKVTLLAPSRDDVQAGDEISVGYDTRWGRGICVAAQN